MDMTVYFCSHRFTCTAGFHPLINHWQYIYLTLLWLSLFVTYLHLLIIISFLVRVMILLFHKTNLLNKLLILFCLISNYIYLTVGELCHHPPHSGSPSLCVLLEPRQHYCLFSFLCFFMFIWHSQWVLMECTHNLWNPGVSINETFHFRGNKHECHIVHEKRER